MKAVITIKPLKNDCKFVKWYNVHSLGGRRFAFCNADEGKTLLNDMIPSPPHGELCSHVAGDECRFFKPKKEK